MEVEKNEDSSYPAGAANEGQSHDDGKNLQSHSIQTSSDSKSVSSHLGGEGGDSNVNAVFNPNDNLKSLTTPEFEVLHEGGTGVQYEAVSGDGTYLDDDSHLRKKEDVTFEHQQQCLPKKMGRRNRSKKNRPQSAPAARGGTKRYLSRKQDKVIRNQAAQRPEWNSDNKVITRQTKSFKDTNKGLEGISDDAGAARSSETDKATCQPKKDKATRQPSKKIVRKDVSRYASALVSLCK